mmetsp:Transcript_23064/g.51346  ORF Transcript_23064/g.51346 Transcript_23064/m.51346 type:complete len:148 (-) Transcript_23064:78-521(-)
MTEIGLFVATDIPNLHRDKVFRNITSTLKRTLKENHGIDLRFLFRDLYPERSSNRWRKKTISLVRNDSDADAASPGAARDPSRKGPLSEAKALFDRKNNPHWVGYPGIFLDQQLAACATIGFVGTDRSTFSKLIEELRKDDLGETCA